MSQVNPYASPQSYDSTESTGGPRRVSIRPFEAISRGYKLLGEQYWMYFLFCFLCVLVASFVPFGLLYGPVMVGLFLCLLEREQGRQFDMNILMRGFDNFLNSLVAIIIMVGINLLVIGPLTIVFMAFFLANTATNRQPDPVLMFGSIFIFAGLTWVLSILTYLPFVFCFQLLADRKMAAWDAIKLSLRAVRMNLGGVILLMLTGFALSILLAMMCYFPVFLFMPVWFAALQVVYRDIFPEEIVNAQVTQPQ